MKSGRNDDERKVRKVAPIEKGGAPQGQVNKAPQVTPQVPAGECHLKKVGVQEACREGGTKRGESPHHGGGTTKVGPTTQAGAGGRRRSTRWKSGVVVAVEVSSTINKNTITP